MADVVRRRGRRSPSGRRTAAPAAHDGSGLPVRALAAEVLLAVESGAFADAELGRRLAASRLDPRDRSLAAQLVYGTLAWQGQLDHFLQALGKSAAALDPPIRVLVRMALFQLGKLSRVPEFAAVSTAVELAKRHRSGVAAGLVNALLRRYLRERDRLAPPPRERDLAAHLAVAYSHPRWMVELWLAQLGTAQTEALLAADNEPAPTVLRVNRLRIEREALLARFTAEGIRAHPTPFSPDGIVIEDGGDLTALPGHSDGLFSAQGETSQLIAFLLGARPGQRILDACAAPGGKTAHIAEQMHDTGDIISLDVNERGLRRLRAEARRLGLTCIRTAQVESAAARSEHPTRFHGVLVDAPCSGLGTLRQHPEIRWRRTPESVDEMARLQRSILAAAAERVEDGGALVYSTCTITAAENDEVVSDFLARHRGFHIESAADHLPPAARALVDPAGFLRTFPEQGLDGFFAVRLRRAPR